MAGIEVGTLSMVPDALLLIYSSSCITRMDLTYKPNIIVGAYLLVTGYIYSPIPMHDYSETSPIIVHRANSQESVHRNINLVTTVDMEHVPYYVSLKEAR